MHYSPNDIADVIWEDLWLRSIRAAAFAVTLRADNWMSGQFLASVLQYANESDFK